jgi:ferredoxin
MISYMAHIVTEPCNDCKYTDCCVVCPVECFYVDEKMLYINPNDCIDCEACVPECPVEAIYAEANTPAQWSSYIQLNAERSAALAGDGHITEKRDPQEGPDCKKK